MSEQALPIVNCPHHKPGDDKKPHACGLGYYGGSPSVGVCTNACPEYAKHNNLPAPAGASEDEKLTKQQAKMMKDRWPKDRRFRNIESMAGKNYHVEGRWWHEHAGLGDTVKWAIEKVSFGLIKQKKGCGCAKRQNWLNRKFPYPWAKRMR